jgi:hypothetical protein
MLNGRSYLRDKHAGSVISNFNTSQSGGQVATPHRAENINLARLPSNRNVSYLVHGLINPGYAHFALSLGSRSTRWMIG